MSDNAYHKVYQLKRYHRRRREAIAQLGGKCVKCGSAQDLQIDHINPEEKEFTLSDLWGIAEKTFKKELDKCQILCKLCHIQKTAAEQSRPNNHGTYWQYKKYGCRCQPCKEGFKKKNRQYKLGL